MVPKRVIVLVWDVWEGYHVRNVPTSSHVDLGVIGAGWNHGGEKYRFQQGGDGGEVAMFE